MPHAVPYGHGTHEFEDTCSAGQSGCEVVLTLCHHGSPTDIIISSSRAACPHCFACLHAHFCPMQGHLAQVVGTKLVLFSHGILAPSAYQYTMKVFLDIDIGDREAYSRDLAAYRVTAEFLEQVGSQVMM